MAKIGKISAILRDYSDSQLQTMEKGLAQKKMTRTPGTGVFKYPYKELDGKYRTGLDPDAAYIKRISDPLEKELEIKRVKDLKERLQSSFGDIDLSPRSKFWNYALATSNDDSTHVQPAKLMDGDNLFDFSSPFQELTFSWLRVHPTIARSFQAYQNGEYPDAQFYVADEEIETKIAYQKKQLVNSAVIKFDKMSPEKRRKVARLLGLPVSDNTKDEIVYNQVDSVIKEAEFKSGTYKGLSTIEVFNRFADMKEDLLHVKDLVKQAIAHSIYRAKPNGRIYEGEFEVAVDEESLVRYLMDEDNQDALLTLEGKLKAKKIAMI